MIASLRQFTATFIEIPEKDWMIIESNFTKEYYKRNELIVNEGEICRAVWFVEKGLFRWFFNKDGEEITKLFSAAPGMLTSKYSFHRQEPSLESILALTDATMWRIGYEDYQKLLELHSWNTFIRLDESCLYKNFNIDSVEREISNRFLQKTKR